MDSKDLIEEKQNLQNDLIDTCKFEIEEMQKILDLMHSEKWEEVDFQLSLKNPEEWKSIISKFNFGDCIPKKYILGMKKLCVMAFQDGIKDKKEKLEKLIKNLSESNL